MSKIRGVIALCILAVLAGGVLLAQDAKKTGDDKKEPAAKAKGTLPANWKKLGLTDEQVQKIYRLQGDYRDKIGGLESKIKGLKDEEKTEMEKILTEAQKARLKEIKSGDSAEKKP